MQIELLADRLELLPLVARWHFDEWSRDDSPAAFQSWIDRLAGRANRDRIPITYLAYIDGSPVGTAMLVESDMDTRPEISPWVAGVYVHPSRRRQGIASALVRHAASQAWRFGYPDLFLYTNGAEPLYSSLGWGVWGREEYEGRLVTIMQLKP